MGMFDSFYVDRFRCPKCNKYWGTTEFQTKDLDCVLDKYGLYDKVDGFHQTDNKGHYYNKGIVNLYNFCGTNYNHETRKYKDGCGESWNYIGIIREGRFFGVINSEGIEDFDKEINKLWRKYNKWLTRKRNTNTKK